MSDNKEIITSFSRPLPSGLGGPSGKGVLIPLVHVHKKYITRIGDRHCVILVFIER